MAEIPNRDRLTDDPSAVEPSESAFLGAGHDLPDELPPVKPPSAGFLVQLFVVPGLIVLAVVGVWALFGRMVSTGDDWQALTSELRSPNEHRRWRAALGLAQMLKTDQDRGDEGRQLAKNPQVARELADLLEQQLESRSASEDDLSQQVFLARTLGLIDVPEAVLPILQQAMRSDHDREVRKNAIASVAVIAGRAADRDRESNDSSQAAKLAAFPALVDGLIAASLEKDELIRQLSAFTLGLLPSDDSRQRLTVMLSDGDEKTRVNAAVGLARQRSTAGLPVFEAQLRDAAGRVGSDDGSEGVAAVETRSSRYFWLAITLLGLFPAAIWSVVTRSTVMRAVAGLASVGTLVASCWIIYDLVQNPPVETASWPPIHASDGTEVERLQAMQAARFEGLVALKNTLKAVGELNGEFTDEQRMELAALIEPIAERHREPRIRIEATETLGRLRGGS